MNSLIEKTYDLAVIGGGITGLSAAYFAAKKGEKVLVIEAGNNFGGLLSTFEIGNNRLEYYYHHFFTHDAELNWLINDLNINDKLLYSKTTMGVFKDGRIFKFNTPVDLLLFKPINFIDKIRFGLTSIYLGKIANWRYYENISCMEWLKKWAGSSTTDSLWEPLLKIKFGPYASKVPLSWMIGRLRQRMNSRKNGDERLGYLDGSMHVLIDSLIQKLNELDVELITNSSVENIRFQNDEIYSIATNKCEFLGKKFLFTIPSPYLSRLLEKNYPNLSEKLCKIKYFGAICVILELDRPLSNIYWLNIADKEFPFGGIIEHTNFVNPTKYDGSHIVYLSRYFAEEEKISSLNETEIKELMLQYLHKIYDGFKIEWVKNIFINKTNSAAPVCDFNFSKKIPNCKTQINNLFIANMSHVYPDERSTNNSIRIAAEACRVMGINTGYVPKNNSLSGKIGF